jgi:hypothetical protein
VTKTIKDLIEDDLYSLSVYTRIHMLLTDIKINTLRDLPFFLCAERPQQSIDSVDIVGAIADLQEKSNSVCRRKLKSQ